MTRFAQAAILLVGVSATGAGKVVVPRPPVIDMHVHSISGSPEEQLARMTELNIRFIWLTGLAPDFPVWSTALPAGRFLQALFLPCPSGRGPFAPRPCWEGSADFPNTNWLREEVRTGRIKALGEMAPQLFGISPADPRFEPYWALAEEFDVPVAVHMGSGPPNSAYEPRFNLPDSRMALNDPMLLEEVLLRHKRLRVLLMHAGWPFLDRTVALLHAHPHVYVDLGALQVGPRAGYYRHLRGLVESGFGARIVFGSDVPSAVASGIDAVRAADFLSDGQKADILCLNAMRFLRLPAATCTP